MKRIGTIAKQISELVGLSLEDTIYYNNYVLVNNGRHTRFSQIGVVLNIVSYLENMELKIKYYARFRKGRSKHENLSGRDVLDGTCFSIRTHKSNPYNIRVLLDEYEKLKKDKLRQTELF